MRDLATTRQRLECKIAELIDLLDIIDGDPDLEDDDREPEETDQNGDEGDYSPSEECTGFLDAGYDGSGMQIADALIRSNSACAARAEAVAEKGRVPILYYFRGLGL